MQPCRSIDQSAVPRRISVSTAPRSCTRSTATAPSTSLRGSKPQAGLALCLAQRAFAALIEDDRRVGVDRRNAFRAAQLPMVARGTLSVLSADDRSRLCRWLSVQIAAGSHCARRASNLLSKVDLVLARRIHAVLAQTRRELFAPTAHETARAGTICAVT